MEKRNILEANTVYQVVTGSTSYGLATTSSDVDQKAIVILPPEYKLQLSKEWETTTYHNPDVEFHSLKKVMQLLSSQNPTMLEILFVPDQFIVKQSMYGELLREHRDLFLSQNCYYAFGGYAKDQLMRIKNGLERATKQDQDDHLQDKMERVREQLLSNDPSLSTNQLRINHVYHQNDKQDVDLTLNFDTISLTQLHSMVAELTNVLKGFNKVNHRNRKASDKLSKHVMHLVRLLLMGIEVLQTGQLTVHREKDRDLLMAIRNEDYSWEELFKITEQLFLQLEQAKQNSVLPEHINKQKINTLYFDLISDYYQLK